MAQMDDIQLIAIIEQQESNAIGYFNGEIADEQALATDYYNSKPLGTEEEGRSSVMSSDVFDVVEGMTPQILKPFVSSDEVIRFNPHGPEDVEAAEQESDYINYVVTQKNNVFEQLTNWVKTGLLQKNGIVKYWWDESRKAEIERYYGLTDDQFAMMMQEIDGNKDITVKAHSEEMVEMDGMQMMMHDVELRITKVAGEARYAVVPPEEFLISRDAKSIDPQRATFVEHRQKLTLSAIREMGYEVDDKDIDLSANDTDLSQQALARLNADETETFNGEFSDISMRETLFREIYMQTDYDGDGIAELRKICMVGKRILENEETEEIPFCAWTPYLQAFKFYGKCPADETVEIQLVKTTLIRQNMDNIYTINNNRTFVSNDVNIDDLLDNAIGGVVRLKDKAQGGVSNHVMSMPVTPIGGIIQPMIEYWDTAKENRTGFTRYNQGMDANSLNKTATGVRIITEQSNLKAELVSRTFAECGLKPLMLGIHGLCRRHSTQQETVRLRGKWVNVDPRQWKTRTDMTISVGLGNSDNQIKMQGIQSIINTQKDLAAIPQLGLVKPQNVFNAAAEMAKTQGFKDAEKFFTRPPEGEQPPAIPPEMQQQMQEMQQQLQQLTQENHDLKQGFALKQQEISLKKEELDLKHAVAVDTADLEQQKVDISKVSQENAFLKDVVSTLQEHQNDMLEHQSAQSDLLQSVMKIIVGQPETEDVNS